jgi:hypothetical protein
MFASLPSGRLINQSSSLWARKVIFNSPEREKAEIAAKKRCALSYHRIIAMSFDNESLIPRRCGLMRHFSSFKSPRLRGRHLMAPEINELSFRLPRKIPFQDNLIKIRFSPSRYPDSIAKSIPAWSAKCVSCVVAHHRTAPSHDFFPSERFDKKLKFY